jgi:hypothetical protein
MNVVKGVAAFAITLATVVNVHAADVVETSSDSYKTGQLIGQVFLVVLAILIIRKLFFTK